MRARVAISDNLTHRSRRHPPRHPRRRRRRRLVRLDRTETAFESVVSLRRRKEARTRGRGQTGIVENRPNQHTVLGGTGCTNRRGVSNTRMKFHHK